MNSVWRCLLFEHRLHRIAVESADEIGSFDATTGCGYYAVVEWPISSTNPDGITMPIRRNAQATCQPQSLSPSLRPVSARNGFGKGSRLRPCSFIIHQLLNGALNLHRKVS